MIPPFERAPCLLSGCSSRRPYVVNLLPCISRICQRPEEAIQETLATAMTRMCPVLMGFTNDAEVKVSFKKVTFPWHKLFQFYKPFQVFCHCRS